jgi:CHASE3 domain sensor protein
MMENWTFGKKIAVGFAIPFVLLALIGGVAYRSLQALTETSYQVARSHEVLGQISLLLSLVKDAETGQRGYIITGDESFLEPYQGAVSNIDGAIDQLRKLTAENPVQLRKVEELRPVLMARMSLMRKVIDLRRAGQADASIAAVKDGEGKRLMDELRATIHFMEQTEREELKRRADDVETAFRSARLTLLLGTLLCLALVALAGAVITRTLGQQIGTTVQRVQSSSAELQAAANQQASGAKQQATALNEITTTISELLVTTRQIAESAQRVAQIADQTAGAARSGDGTVERGNEAVTGIRRQVELIVNHMLELSKKSQQIGSVLDIVAELAEQTNILAINATIEAAGAGESGKRFAVVAEEIRKLADRVGGSTKEIRGLIDDVRSAVNTTVMTTETGSKAVEAGAKQFYEVATSFRQIASLVTTTTEAAREIGLSTKQQATAVEQVNQAIASVAQSSRDNETSTGQTLQTASQLSGLARELLLIVQAQASNGVRH